MSTAAQRIVDVVSGKAQIVGAGPVSTPGIGGSKDPAKRMRYLQEPLPPKPPRPQFQNFTPDERKRIGNAISDHIKAGMPKDQAIAVAIKQVAPEKSKSSK